MEFKGTKGKWVVKPDDEYKGIYQIWTEREPYRSPIYLARTCFAIGAEANARLTAAAPELLKDCTDANDRLDKIYNLVTSLDCDDRNSYYIRELINVCNVNYNVTINKALGKEETV